MDFRQNPLIQDSEDLHEIVVEEVDEAAVETIQLLSSFEESRLFLRCCDYYDLKF